MGGISAGNLFLLYLCKTIYLFFEVRCPSATSKNLREQNFENSRIWNFSSWWWKINCSWCKLPATISLGSQMTLVPETFPQMTWKPWNSPLSENFLRGSTFSRLWHAFASAMRFRAFWCLVRPEPGLLEDIQGDWNHGPSDIRSSPTIFEKTLVSWWCSEGKFPFPVNAAVRWML